MLRQSRARVGLESGQSRTSVAPESGKSRAVVVPGVELGLCVCDVWVCLAEARILISEILW